MKKKVFSLMMTLVLGFMGLTQAMAQADFPMVFDFEDNTVPATWVNDAVHPWVVYKLTAPDTDYPGYSGSYYLKSGNAGVNSSTSAIEATVEFPNPGKVSFLGGCYGEGAYSAWDKCQFYIDGEVQFTYGAKGSWDAYEYTVGAGSHTFKWEFSKDYGGAGTGDFFGIDDVKFEVVDACADLPTNSYFKYNVSQQIFTADQLGDLANLGSVKFYNAGDELTRKLDVYVTTTDKETFESETDWVAVDTTNLVFSGDVTFGSFAWTTISFDAPVTIEEGLNVVVTVDDNTDIAIAGLNFSMDTVDAGGNVALYYHSDDTTRFNPDPTDLSTITGTLLGKRNEVEFGEFEFTIYDGTVTNYGIPAYCNWFDNKTTAQHVIPAADLAPLNGLALNGLTWYSTSSNVPFTTTEEVTIYMKEVDFTTFPNPATTAAFVPQAQCQVVYTGTLNIVAADGGGQWVVTFNQPYTYNGGNLLIGVEDSDGGQYKGIQWLGQTVTGASIFNYATYTPTHANFLPKTTFSFGAETPVVFEPNLYMIDMTDSTFVDTLNFGTRPNGYWMRPIDIYSLWNHTGRAINVSRFDFTPEEGFFTAEAIDNELAFQMAIDDTIPMLFTSNVTDTTFADTTFTRQFVVIYDAARTAGVWPVVMTAYNAVEPDVFELARVVDTFEYRDTLNATADFIYDNYRLPDASIPDGYDAVYKLTIDKDVLLNASVDMGENGKVALYTEDFYNYGGPDMENYYQGPSFGGGSAFIQGDAFVQKFSNFEMGDWTTIDADAEPESSWADWNAELFYGRDYNLYGDANDGAASSMSYDVYEDYLYGYGTAYNPDNYLVSPKVTIGSIANFSFWASTYYSSPYDAEHFGVFVSTAGNTNPADFTMVNEWTYTERGNMNGERVSNWTPAGNNRFQLNRGDYQQYTVDLSAYAGQEVYIAIRHFNCTDMGALIVDDITLSNGLTRIGGYEYTATPVIKDLPVTAGTYYLVASSTSEDFSVVIDTTAMPCPQVAEAVYPLDDADDIQFGSGIELKWKLDDYATEYMLLFGSTYYCEDTLVDWTTDLAESFIVLPSHPLYHNTNYFWKVCQRNSSCGTGTDGEVWGFTTTFNAPTNLHATDTSIFEGDDVVMEWTAIEDRTFRSYNVYLNDSLIGSTTTTPNPHSYTSYTIPANLLTYNMNPGHKVEVTAYYDEGESPKSEPYYIKVSGYGKITGKVFEQDGTTGIKNARVYITGVNEFGEPVEMDTVTTSNNGRYTINRVPVSGDSISYQAFAEKEGYQSPVEPIEGNPRPVAYRGTTQANFILDEVFAPVPPCAVFAEFYPDPEVEDEYVKVTWTMNGGESVNIDFETNDFSQGTFNNTVSSYPWVITTDNVHTGTYAMKSSNAGVAGSTSAIEATVTLSYDGNVSFWALCQGEGTSTVWDKCIFKIDNVEKFSYGASVTGWNEYTYDLTAGTHTLRWEYTKDSSVDPTGDAMWVDDIHFGSAPGGREVAEDRSFQYYRIYRTSCYNDGPYNSSNTVLLGNNDTPADLEFVDVNWKTVGPGVYKWGVSRVYEGNREDYPNGRESEISWTCECIDKDMYLNNVRVTVLLNSADSPEGTTVNFTNLNEVEEQNHPMGTITLDESGYYKFGADNPFRKGDYVVTVEHEGYISETDTVSIWSNKHLRYVLTEIIYGTRDAYVSRTGWAMWDDALTGGNVPGGGGGSGELTVNDGTAYNAYIPYYGLYADVEQTSEFVIPAAELSAMTGSPINSMKFYVKGTAYAAVAGPFQVYMAEVASTTMSAVSGPAAGTVVYTGALDATGEEMTVNFTTPYNYNGGNLLVGIYTAGDGNYSSSTFYGVDQTENTAICQYMGYSGLQNVGVKFLPKTTFAYGNRALASGDQNGNRVANATENTRHLEGYKVMCTNSFGEPIFNENTPHKFCQVATDRLVEGQKYYFQVAAIYSTGMSPYCDPVEWEYESCENYQDIAIEGEVTPAGNVISWLGGTPGPGPGPGPGPQPTGDATIILTAGDVWGDGSGYQMLLDDTHSLYGTTIPAQGSLSMNCSGNEAIYAQFSHKIPTNADGNCTTQNIVINNSVSITVPAGTYDWCITNPTPYDQIWIASSQGNVGGRQDDYVFEAGLTYEFTVSANPSTGNDQTNVVISGGGKNMNAPMPAGECRKMENFTAVAAVANGTMPGMSNGNFAPLQSGPFRGATGYANCVYSMSWPNAYVSFDVDAPNTATNVSNVTINRGGDYADGFFYGFNDGGVFYKLNYETGAVIEQHTTSGALTEMAYNYANNTMYGISNANSGNSQLVTVDLATGNTTPIGSGMGYSIMAFAIDLNGNAYGISITDGNFYSIDLTAGTGTLIGNTGKAVNYVQCMNFDHNTETLYWFQISGADDCALYSVNTTNGACTLVMNMPGEVTSFAVPFEGTPGPGPGPQPTPEGVIGYMLFRDGEWLAELPVDVTSYLDAEGGAHDYTMRVIYGGEAVLPSNNYNYAMSCGSTIELGYEVVCEPGDPISGAYYYESANDFGAVISWEPQPEPPTPTPPTDEATIILTAGDVWGDGTGYQMLLDADATAFGNEIPATGPYTLNNYDAFEYLIPVNADCNTYTSNIVFNNSIAITVPAGTYDWCITNPEPGGNMWIASDNGTAGGRKDNYVFEAGMTYEFVPSMFGQNDGVDVTITPTGTKNRAALTGYNIYRSTTNSNYELIGTAPADATEYRDNVAAGSYFYQVTAVYDNDCESAPAANADDANLNYVEVVVTSVDDNTNRVALYPNPTNGLVKIEANGMRHITVVNALGQVVFDNDITGDEYQINMAQFNAGVYVVRIATENGVSTQRVTVVR